MGCNLYYGVLSVLWGTIMQSLPFPLHLTWCLPFAKVFFHRPFGTGLPCVLGHSGLRKHMYASATLQFTFLVLVLCLPWNYLCQKQFCSDPWRMLHCSFILSSSSTLNRPLKTHLEKWAGQKIRQTRSTLANNVMQLWVIEKWASQKMMQQESFQKEHLSAR